MRRAFSQSGFRVSLREFLLLVAAFAIGLTALNHANSWWLVAVSAATMAAFMAMAIIAVFDRGPPQAFAVGFVLCALIYAGVLLSQRTIELAGQGGSHAVNPEMDADRRGLLPTTVLLGKFYLATCEHWFVDESTGMRYRLEELPPSTTLLNVGLPQHLRDRLGTEPWTASRPPPAQVYPAPATPNEVQFMRIGHMLSGLMIGYIGGHFASLIYARRLRMPAASATREAI